MPRVRRSRALAPLLVATAVTLFAGTSAVAAPKPAASTDPYRPVFHYSAEKNFQNDPNGLIYHEGVYHLFYQTNPYGVNAANGSWGHATSTDLVKWREHPIAIPSDAKEDVWSGSVVFDRTNSSGLGTADNPPLVAVYTSFNKATRIQSQALAFSLDSGMTWTKYAGNPVLDINNRDFRDPKVFWDDKRARWVMVVALSVERKVSIYTSTNLKDWKHESNFGPAGAIANVWECPDLFPLTVDGKQRWVMVVSVSGKTQYFVGDFDGSTFTSPDATYTPPTGRVLGDFEGNDYGSWTTTGTAFGSGPSHATQTDVSGYVGGGYVSSYGPGDFATGTLTSPEFTVDSKYLNFALGGGRHPHVEGGSSGPPPGTVFADFEGETFGTGWTATGDFVGAGTSKANLPGQLGTGVLDTCVGPCDPAMGTITSPTFTIEHDYINFLLAGGNHPMSGPEPTAINLIVDGKQVATATGPNGPGMDWVAWDTKALQGKQAQIQIVDQRTADWGHIMVDHIVFSDVAAKPWDAETTANLVVDGKVVRTATGTDGPGMDWNSWDLSDLQGKQARVQLIDNATGGWGHLLADHFVLANEPALSIAQRVRWIDHGADFYAAVTFNGLPEDKRIMIGWMGNWDYAQATPTAAYGWRGQQSVPRELTLENVDGRPTLISTPVDALNTLERKMTKQSNVSVTSGVKTLNAKGTSLVIDATLTPGTADTFGIDVRVGAGERTRIGYDVAAGELFVDRTQSGESSFSPLFERVNRAKLDLDGEPLQLRIYVDRSSVEVFANGGLVTISNLIYPSLSSTGVQLFAEGGTATLTKMQAREMGPAVKR